MKQNSGDDGVGGRAQRSLDGPWAIAFDPANRGKEARWHERDAPPPGAEAIRVPSCWEETRQDYEGVAWYRRAFTPPGEAENAHLRLHFDAVCYLARVWWMLKATIGPRGRRCAMRTRRC